MYTHFTRFPNDVTERDVLNALARVRANPADNNSRSSLLGLMVSCRSSELPALLAETLDRIGTEKRFYQLGGAAMKAAAALTSSNAGLAAGWLSWATDVLNVHRGDRSSQMIANTIPTLYTPLRDHLVSDRIPSSELDRVEEALHAAAEAMGRWYVSVSERVPHALR